MSHSASFNEALIKDMYPGADEDAVAAIATMAAEDKSNDNRMEKINRAMTEYCDAPVKVNFFAEHGEHPFNEQVNDVLLECENMEIRPPYRAILSWIELTGKEDVPAPEVIIPEEWDAYKGEMGLRGL